MVHDVISESLDEDMVDPAIHHKAFPSNGIEKKSIQQPFTKGNRN
jgi:hypothetical protein